MYFMPKKPLLAFKITPDTTLAELDSISKILKGTIPCHEMIILLKNGTMTMQCEGAWNNLPATFYLLVKDNRVRRIDAKDFEDAYKSCDSERGSGD